MSIQVTQRQSKRAMHVLDHAIDHLGETRPCYLLIVDGHMANLPSTESNADAARAVLIAAMLRLVKETGQL